MNASKLCVTDFKIVWNNSGVNTVCPICGDRTEPSINFQVQTQGGDAICETCLIEEATDAAEVLYAYFAYKYPHDDMVKMFLTEIKKQQLVSITKPKVVPAHVLEELQEAIDAVMLCTEVTREITNDTSIEVFNKFLVTKKWLAVNEPAYAECINTDNDYAYSPFDGIDPVKGTLLYKKALEDGAVIAESIIRK